MNALPDQDQQAIDALVADFFGVFDNRDGRRPDLRRLEHLLIPEAVIVKNSGSTPEVYGVRSFIEPREKLLTDGSLVDFAEVEISGETAIVGNIASRRSLYRKSGVLHGQRFETRGVKFLLLVRTPSGWRISTVIWDDEREGLVLPT